jgi:hypothetical protein
MLMDDDFFMCVVNNYLAGEDAAYCFFVWFQQHPSDYAAFEAALVSGAPAPGSGAVAGVAAVRDAVEALSGVNARPVPRSGPNTDTETGTSAAGSSSRSQASGALDRAIDTSKPARTAAAAAQDALLGNGVSAHAKPSEQAAVRRAGAFREAQQQPGVFFTADNPVDLVTRDMWEESERLHMMSMQASPGAQAPLKPTSAPEAYPMMPA